MAKTWLITGASRGFGRQLAEAVLDAGDQLVATARQPEQLDDLVAAHAERVQAVALDVTDAAAAEAAVKTAVEAFGGLDVVVNNAGYANSAPIEEMTEDDFRAQVETNLFGVVERDASSATCPPPTAIRDLRAVLVHRRASRRHAGDGGLPNRQVRGRRLL